MRISITREAARPGSTSTIGSTFFGEEICHYESFNLPLRLGQFMQYLTYPPQYLFPGAIDQSHAKVIWKKTYARLGLSECPPPKVFVEFLASFKP